MICFVVTLETSLTTSAKSSARSKRNPHVSRSGRRSRLSKAWEPAEAAVPRVAERAECPVLNARDHSHDDGVAHQTSLRSRRTMMICAISPGREAGSLFIGPVTLWTM